MDERSPLPRWAAFVALVATACGPPSGGTDEAEGDRLATLVSHELAFARAASEKGTSAAFSEFVAEDGILFRPGPVEAGPWLRENPGPTPGSLAWVPVQSALAASGDLGYTTGPYIASDGAGQEAHGHYLSIWKATEAGYRVALDIGHPTPPAGPLPTPGVGTPPELEEGSIVSSSTAGASDDLLAVDREYASVQAEEGTLAALRAWGTPGVRINRSGLFPLTGLNEIEGQRSLAEERPHSMMLTGQVSDSQTLGFVYGLVEEDDRSGNFVRIWQRNPGEAWRLAVELFDVRPRADP